MGWKWHLVMWRVSSPIYIMVVHYQVESLVRMSHLLNLSWWWPKLNQFSGAGFLGGLSLHLNHLIGSWSAISFGQFGTLPIDIFLSNLVSRQLETFPRAPWGPFWHMSIFGNSRAVRVLWPKTGVFRKSMFTPWRSDGASKWLGGFRWAGT